MQAPKSSHFSNSYMDGARMDVKGRVRGSSNNGIQSAPGRKGLQRKLVWYDLISIGFAATIGAGVFLNLGVAAQSMAGPSVVISYLISGIIAFICSLCYCELSSIIPHSGSAYSYSSILLGDMMGSITGMFSILTYSCASAFIASLFSSQLQSFISSLTSSPLPYEITHSPFVWDGGIHSNSLSKTGAYFDLIAFIIVLAVNLIPTLSVRVFKYFNNILTVVKVCVILIVIISGAVYIDTSNWKPFLGSFQTWYSWSLFHEFPVAQTSDMISTSDSHRTTGILTGSFMVFSTIIGFDSVSTTAQECVLSNTNTRIKKMLPYTIAMIVPMCMIIYIGVAIVITGMIPYSMLDVDAPMSSAFKFHQATWCAHLIDASSFIFSLSVLCILLYTFSRVLYSMSRDGQLPLHSFLSLIHPYTCTPVYASIASGLLISCIAATIPYDILIETATHSMLCVYAMTCVTLIFYRNSERVSQRIDVHRRSKHAYVRIPFASLLPCMGVCGCVFYLLQYSPQSWCRIGVWFLISTGIYVLYGRKCIRHVRMNKVQEAVNEVNQIELANLRKQTGEAATMKGIMPLMPSLQPPQLNRDIDTDVEFDRVTTVVESGSHRIHSSNDEFRAGRRSGSSTPIYRPSQYHVRQGSFTPPYFTRDDARRSSSMTAPPSQLSGERGGGGGGGGGRESGIGRSRQSSMRGSRSMLDGNIIVNPSLSAAGVGGGTGGTSSVYAREKGLSHNDRESLSSTPRDHVEDEEEVYDDPSNMSKVGRHSVSTRHYDSATQTTFGVDTSTQIHSNHGPSMMMPLMSDTPLSPVHEPSTPTEQDFSRNRITKQTSWMEDTAITSRVMDIPPPRETASSAVAASSVSVSDTNRLQSNPETGNAIWGQRASQYMVSRETRSLHHPTDNSLNLLTPSPSARIDEAEMKDVHIGVVMSAETDDTHDLDSTN